jgi:hypothetical protein
MLRPRVFSIRTVTESALLCLVLIVSSRSAIAQTNDGDYILSLASGFLCDPGDTTTCPATAKDASSNTFEMSGAGTFSPHDKSVTAAGTFARKSPSGMVLDTGVWLATSLVSFDSYGLAPGALKAGNPVRRAMQAGPMMRTRMLVGPTAAGGLAVFRIRLFPITGAPQNALLQVNCALGNVPPERQVEGIRITVEKNGTDFSEEVSGRVMFLSMRPEVSTPAKTPQQGPVPASAETPE